MLHSAAIKPAVRTTFGMMFFSTLKKTWHTPNVINWGRSQTKNSQWKAGAIPCHLHLLPNWTKKGFLMAFGAFCLYLFEKLTSNALGFKQPSSSAVKAADTSPVVDQVAEEKKEGNLLARTDGHAPIKDRSPLGLNNWPLSRMIAFAKTHQRWLLFLHRHQVLTMSTVPNVHQSLLDLSSTSVFSYLDMNSNSQGGRFG